MDEVYEVAFRVEPNYAGWRLDRYLCDKIRRLSRTQVQRIIRESLVHDEPRPLRRAGGAYNQTGTWLARRR